MRIRLHYYSIFVRQTQLLALLSILLHAAFKYLTSHLFSFISGIYCGEQRKNFLEQGNMFSTVQTTINTLSLEYYIKNFEKPETT